MAYTKRFDGRAFDELRPIEAKIGVVPRANGSAYFAFGGTKAIAAVYGPRHLHPAFLQNPEKGILRCYYDLLSWSVTERKRPGPSRRSTEISFVTAKAFESVLKLENFPNTTVDVFIDVIQADASTRCAGINAASMALAQAGIPMTDLVGAVSIGQIGSTILADLTKDEEDYTEKGQKTTDIPIAFQMRSGKISLLQLDGKISPLQLKEVIETAHKACKQIYDAQKSALKNLSNL